MKKIGLIVNPVAGMGGKVGLKGSDGEDTVRRAEELGAIRTSPRRAVDALKRLAKIRDKIEIYTYPKEMGEDEAKEAGFTPRVIGEIQSGETTYQDTRSAALEMTEIGIDIILFVGGDGTARDIYEAIDGKTPVLGIPAGVKIHSGVYAISPIAAGDLALKYLVGETVSLHDAEVMDVDEEAFRENRLSARLYGYLRVPREESLMQTSKEASPVQEEENLKAIAHDIDDEMEEGTLYIIGPGSTTNIIAQHLGVPKTLLGVDVLLNKKIIAQDVSESQLISLVKGKKAKIIVTVIGGQGFIFGRGNQQISPEVIKLVGRENIIIAATPAKLATLQGRPLLVDTGDPSVDKLLSGYVKIITDYSRRVVYRVKNN